MPSKRPFLSFFMAARTSTSDEGFVSTNGLGGVAAARSLNSGQRGAGGKFRADSKCSCHLERISSEEHDDPSSFLTGAVAEFPFLPGTDLMARHAGRRLFCFSPTSASSASLLKKASRSDFAFALKIPCSWRCCTTSPQFLATPFCLRTSKVPADIHGCLMWCLMPMTDFAAVDMAEDSFFHEDSTSSIHCHILSFLFFYLFLCLFIESLFFTRSVSLSFSLYLFLLLTVSEPVFVYLHLVLCLAFSLSLSLSLSVSLSLSLHSILHQIIPITLPARRVKYSRYGIQFEMRSRYLMPVALTIIYLSSRIVPPPSFPSPPPLPLPPPLALPLPLPLLLSSTKLVTHTPHHPPDNAGI